MAALFKLALVGGAFWAYRSGHLDGLLGSISGSQDGPDVISGVPVVQNPLPPPPAPYFGGAVSGMSKEEALLQQNIDVMQPWARQNLTWVAAMMWQESRGNPNAVSPAGALGLMQVMPGTYGDIYGWGYRQFGPDPSVLKQPRAAIYAGTAYLQFLSGKSRDRDWITMAYNAGPGGFRNGAWPSETVKYLAAIKGRHQTLIQ